MSIEPSLERCFKPEERKRGEDIVGKDLVFIASAADTSVKAMIKASGAPRVAMNTDDVGSPVFAAECTCPSFKKGTMCKHVWAVILALDARDADFLTGKTDVEPIVREAKPNPQDEFRRARAEQNKARAKEMRRQQKSLKKNAGAPSASAPSIYPEPVLEALEYFRQNGFDLAADLEMDAVLNAKRTLARVFHPDKGGTHDEAITLNQNFDVLHSYLN